MFTISGNVMIYTDIKLATDNAVVTQFLKLHSLGSFSVIVMYTMLILMAKIKTRKIEN